MKTKGFTLVELLVVIAILAILATVSVVGYTTYINNANQSKAVQELTQIRDYAMAYDLTHDGTDAKDGQVSLAEAEKAISDTKITSAAPYSEKDDETIIVYTDANDNVLAYWDITTGTVTAGTYPAA